MLVEIIPTEGTMTSAGQPKKEKTITAKAAIVAREIIALIFWLYASLKLFIFDVDVFLVDKFVPEHRWLLDLKFFVLIGGVAIIWLLAGSKKFYLWFAYIFFYPLIIILWKIPYFVFRQRRWVFAFALINTAVSFFQSAKYNFIGSAVFLIAVAAIFNTSSTPLIGISVSAIFLLFTAVYIRRFIFVF